MSGYIYYDSKSFLYLGNHQLIFNGIQYSNVYEAINTTNMIDEIIHTLIYTNRNSYSKYANMILNTDTNDKPYIKNYNIALSRIFTTTIEIDTLDMYIYMLPEINIDNIILYNIVRNNYILDMVNENTYKQIHKLNTTSKLRYFMIGDIPIYVDINSSYTILREDELSMIGDLFFTNIKDYQRDRKAISKVPNKIHNLDQPLYNSILYNRDWIHKPAITITPITSIKTPVYESSVIDIDVSIMYSILDIFKSQYILDVGCKNISSLKASILYDIESYTGLIHRLSINDNDELKKTIDIYKPDRRYYTLTDIIDSKYNYDTIICTNQGPFSGNELWDLLLPGGIMILSHNSYKPNSSTKININNMNIYVKSGSKQSYIPLRTHIYNNIVYIAIRGDKVLGGIYRDSINKYISSIESSNLYYEKNDKLVMAVAMACKLYDKNLTLPTDELSRILGAKVSNNKDNLYVIPTIPIKFDLRTYISADVQNIWMLINSNTLSVYIMLKEHNKVINTHIILCNNISVPDYDNTYIYEKPEIVIQPPYKTSNYGKWLWTHMVTSKYTDNVILSDI